MSEKKVVVKIDHVSKYFKLPTEASQSLRTNIVNYFRGVKGYKEQYVLRDIDFEVEEGDFYGILGRNGSGKSTLLKIISQIYTPEHGSVTVDGKMVSFIELGVGFNPELTGRENVYLNGAMLGFTRAEIDAMYDDIVDFAELSEFMNQKLKNYSSGMQVRLAFSVAIKAQGDILILDEVLAVGDEAFQRKCNDYFMERKASGKTTILVTHDMGAVKKYCNKAVLIEDGLVKSIGNPDDVANQYSLDNVLEINISPNSEEPEEEKKVLLVDNFKVELISKQQVIPEQEISFQFSFDLLEDRDVHIAMSFVDVDSNAGYYNDNSMPVKIKEKGHYSLRYTCNFHYLNHARLRLEASVRDDKKQVLAFAQSFKAPVVFIQRELGDLEDESLRDSATGMLVRTGKWEN